ncbi:acetylxylan esterase [Oceanobacillus manasiensis]|uniref:acetylxylan esterase n=1 Tax=Oceanobacillus manasiensis TaxID=586413 RepID=UPI0005A66B67|nr:alpha/beta fold hydrolase [Oceanobacillus manasiensis]
MEHIQHTMEKLKTYIPASTKRADHAAFWQETLEDSNRQPLSVSIAEKEYPIKQIKVFHVVYQGFNGTPIHAHYILPRNVERKMPCLLFFHGYGMNKSTVSHYMQWLIQGYAVMAVDTRGHGHSGDAASYSNDVSGSWVTKGILDKYEYYYRNVYVDAIRAIDFLSTRAEINQDRIGIIGGSMGGGITLAVAALDNRPRLAVADMPNMCDIPLAMEQKMEGSLTIVESFLRQNPQHTERVYETLSYFDHVNLAEQITCQTRLAIGLRDVVCPPQPSYGVYNVIQSPKSIAVYPFSGHDMSMNIHVDKTLEFIADHL